MLSSDESSPWAHIVNLSKNSLVEKGFLKIIDDKKLFKFKKYVYPESGFGDINQDINQAQEFINEFAKNKLLYDPVVKSVAHGIASRREIDTDSSFDD